MKHVTYYLLVSISFPYIHTRQIGHDEGPELLVIGELEYGRHRALGGQAGHSHVTWGSLGGITATQTLHNSYLGIFLLFLFQTHIHTPAS